MKTQDKMVNAPYAPLLNVCRGETAKTVDVGKEVEKDEVPILVHYMQKTSWGRAVCTSRYAVSVEFLDLVWKQRYCSL